MQSPSSKISARRSPNKKRNRRSRRHPEPLISRSASPHGPQPTIGRSSANIEDQHQTQQASIQPSTSRRQHQAKQPSTQLSPPRQHEVTSPNTELEQAQNYPVLPDSTVACRLEPDPPNPPLSFRIASDPVVSFQDEESDSEMDAYLEAQLPTVDLGNLNLTFDVFASSDDENDVEDLQYEGDEGDEDLRRDTNTQARVYILNKEQMRSVAEGVLLSMKKKMRRSVLLAAVSLYGKCRYTLEHYDHLVVMMRDAGASEVLPSASTMRKVIFPRMVDELFVQSRIHPLPTKRGFSKYSRTSVLSRRQFEAVVVLPSAWARMDVRCLHVLRDIVCISRCRCLREFGSQDLRVDSTNHVVKRENLSRHSDALWLNKEGVPVPSSIGTTITFHSPEEQAVSEHSRRLCGLKVSHVKYRGESCTSFNAQIISTHHVCYSSDKGITIEVGEKPRELRPGLQSLHNECIEYLKALSRKNHERLDEVNTSDKDDGECSEADSPRTRRQRNKRQKRSDTDGVDTPAYLVPSDHLTIVQLDGTELFGVFISRFWVRRLDDERNIFLFLDRDRQGRLSHIPTLTLGAPAFAKEPSSNASENQTETNNIECQTKGRLGDGVRYYIYRILLYADDFNPRSTLFPKGSVGGLYMSPSGFNIRAKRSQSTVRTVCLTPPGVSTNSALDLLIDDLVTGSIDGFETVDAFGERVRVFFDVMGFLGDYPASSSVVDLKGHTATSPCTHCGITCTKNGSMSAYAYTTTISSCSTAYRRSQRRTTSIREAGLTTFQHKCLGMSEVDLDASDMFNNSPMLKFASVYNERLKHTVNALPIASFDKDGYSLNVVAPDHLISGLFKGLLTIVFIQLKNDTVRNELQIYLRQSLSEYGFQTQSVLFKKKKLVPGLSMSVLYCIQTVLISTLKALNALDTLPCRRLVENLHRLFSTLFWWPSLCIDGRKSWEFVHGKRMPAYHRSLQILAANFVKSANKFIRENPDLAPLIDRPNIHRLIELTHHTIPIFNHVTFVCELVFESSHQPLKFYLSRNHTLSSHIYAVHLVLAKDWMMRLWHLWRIYRRELETPHHRRHAFVGLVRLLAGKQVDDCNWDSSDLADILERLREHVHHLMIGTIEGRFEKWYDDAKITHNIGAKWVLKPPPRAHKFPAKQQAFLSKSLANLAKLCMVKEAEVQICLKALMNRGHGATTKSSHERIELGDVIQVLTTPGLQKSTFLTPFICDWGTPQFFVVGGFFRSAPSGLGNGSSFACVQRCTLISPSCVSQLLDCNRTPTIEVATSNFYLEQGKVPTQYVELTQNVSKVGVIHHCGAKAKGKCKFSSSTRKVVHSTTTLNGGHFFLLTRPMSYPPRRS